MARRIGPPEPTQPGQDVPAVKEVFYGPGGSPATGAMPCCTISADHLGDRRLGAGRIGALGDDRHPVAARPVERIAAKVEGGIALLDRAQPLGDAALHQALGMHRPRDDRPTAGQPRRESVEHRLHDARHPRHHMHVADGKAGRRRDGIVDQRGAARHGRHALAGGIELTRPVAAFHARPGFRVRLPRHAERGGDAFAGDVVMGRADAAGREHVIEARPHLVDGADDGFRDIGDHPHLAQRHADLTKPGGDEADIGVLGAAGENLVADHQQA